MIKVANVCCYCEVGTDLTNEHLFPECILQKTPSGQSISIARTPDGDKAISSAIQTKDVCAHCNNVALSALDTYVCRLHDQFFQKIVHRGNRVDFRFDFDLLLRWLLKTSYNASRGSASFV
jgi:hypothetical protein